MMGSVIDLGHTAKRKYTDKFGGMSRNCPINITVFQLYTDPRFFKFPSTLTAPPGYNLLHFAPVTCDL